MKTNRKGSALLIVLGMLSFMVVSAVSFAMYMRQSRVPSSYLRRSASSRYLLKAALANAIARLDGRLATKAQIYPGDPGADTMNGYCEGVYDDPYPGVGPSADLPDRENGDLWVKRVFCPFGPVAPTEDANGALHYDTVSTLTLEGLAYLPPAIINEARVYSRLTRTAQWRNLAFDAGRYAFCAVDVSDCFDLNRLSAGERRSSAPGERVNLSSLFPQNGGELDTILKKCSNYWTPGGGNIPFVSLADFNVVAGAGSAFAPFAKCVNTANGINPFIAGSPQTVSNALFITDTWFPPTNATAAAATRIDLSKEGDADSQPFTDYTVKNFLAIPEGGKLTKLLRANMDLSGLACLYDYLDRDRIPISLALPTVETVPMICTFGMGVNPAGGELAPVIEEKEVAKIPYEITEGNKTKNRERTITGYTLTVPDCQILLSGAAAFPFKHVSGERKGAFTVETLVAVYFAEQGMKCRVSEETLRPKPEDWTQDQHVRDGVIWCKGQSQQNPTFKDNITATQDAVQQFVSNIRLGKTQFPVFYHIEETEKVTDSDGNTVKEEYVRVKMNTTDSTRQGTTPLTVFDAEGRISDPWKKAYTGDYLPDLYKTVEELKAGKEQHEVKFNDPKTYKLRLSVWARVIDSKQQGKSGNAVVDLVPATCDDDEVYLKDCSYGALKTQVYKMSGEGTPLLGFPSDRSFSYSNEGEKWKQMLDGTAAKFEYQTLIAPDPRFNFAPEDWYAKEDGEGSPNGWLTAVEGLLGTEGRDPDIFMFTSDQEYLQSIGELAFLPNIQTLTGSVTPLSGEFCDLGRYDGNANFKGRQNLGSCANGEFMWRTYTPVRHHGSGLDPIYSMRWGGQTYEVVSGSGDFRVNPFSSDARVLMAALLDTPADWYFASNDEDRNPTYKPTADPSTWAFCANSAVGARIDDEELQDVAEAMRRKFAYWAREAAPKDRVHWEKAYDDLRWYDGQKGDAQKLLFSDYISEDFQYPLHGVDRKFLYSFWRECFQNRQQLFLVFLRAEPLTVGGMGEGSLASAQLGARGVALVWRDPLPPARTGGNGQRPLRTALTGPDAYKNLYDNFGPHRTRVLFYHQFD